MRLGNSVALLLVALPAVAPAKTKKSDVPAVFRNATYVYVESPDGDLYRPGVYPEDREAIADVQDALRGWNRYTLTTRRDQAELVFVVRKGRVANGRIGGSIPVGQPLPPAQTPARMPGQTGPGQAGNGPAGTGPAIGGPSLETGVEAGSDDDNLRVYTLSTEGKLQAIVWNRSQTDGLDEPQLILFAQLRAAVDKAYPSTTASQPSKP
jgi:hypothetical protein